MILFDIIKFIFLFIIVIVFFAVFKLLGVPLIIIGILLWLYIREKPHRES